MDIFNGLHKNFYKSLGFLTNKFGVSADIYLPDEFNNLQHGFRDDNIKYVQDAISMRVLIPAIFRRGNEGSQVQDLLFEDSSDDIVMYLKDSVFIPKYSKVVLRLDVGIRNYIIQSVISINDGDMLLFTKYLLIPSLTLDVDRNNSELQRAVDYELSCENLFLDEGIVDDSGFSVNSIYVREPIK